MKTKVYVVDIGRTHLALRWEDRLTRRWAQKSAGTADRLLAERLAGELEAEINAGRHERPCRVGWEEFRERYELEKLDSLSPKTYASACSALNQVEKHLRPRRLADVDAEALSLMQSRMREGGSREATIATHLRHVRAALGWAHTVGMLDVVPKVAMPRRARGRGQRLMRGRPLLDAEFERLLAAAVRVRPHDAGAWCFYLRGLWLSGLRVSESLTLGWDESAPLAIELSGRFPKMRILAEAEKGFQDRLLPLTPDFAEFLLAIPESERRGVVFRLEGERGGKQISADRAKRVVSAIGRAAGVVVNAGGKYASAHDLRRSFGTRWAARVKPARLQLLMRHESVETTMKYYVHQEADEVAAELWAAYGGGPQGRENGAKMTPRVTVAEIE